MPSFKPFCAVRPTRDKVGLIASRSYNSYTEAERNARLDTNPYSFLHIVNPGYKYDKEIYGYQRFGLVRNRFEEFLEDAYFIKDEKPAFYFHKIVDRENKVFRGIIGLASTLDYEKKKIKEHENTIADRVKTFTEYLNVVGFHAEPVLLTYPDRPKINQIFDEISSERAEYEFTTTYRDTHYLWVVNDPKRLEALQAEFAEVKALYIADGHHRSASSSKLAKDFKKAHPNSPKNEALQHFMVYTIPESELVIAEFNRVVKDLDHMGKEEFLIRLDAHFRIENRGNDYYRPTKRNHFSMYLDGDFYSLYLRRTSQKTSSVLDQLDVQILYDKILKPILGIENPRNNDRIGYIHGKKGMAEVKGLVDSKAYAVGFGMLPPTIEQIKQIADEGLKMPPKATYIEPKLRSGITIYDFK